MDNIWQITCTPSVYQPCCFKCMLSYGHMWQNIYNVSECFMSCFSTRNESWHCRCQNALFLSALRHLNWSLAVAHKEVCIASPITWKAIRCYYSVWIKLLLMSFSRWCIEYNGVNRIWNDVSTSNPAHRWSTWVRRTCMSNGTSSGGSASSPACRRKIKTHSNIEYACKYTPASRGSSEIAEEGSSDPTDGTDMLGDVERGES